jgi:hypothetical protein
MRALIGQGAAAMVRAASANSCFGRLLQARMIPKSGNRFSEKIMRKQSIGA